MLSIFIMLIIAIALCGAIGYSILVIIKSGEVSIGVQKNQGRVEMVAAAIRTALVDNEGSVLIPVDYSSSGATAPVFSVVPSFAPFRDTAYGKPIVYCPVSPVDVNAGDTSLVKVDGSENYKVKVAEIDGKRYIAGGRPVFAADADQNGADSGETAKTLRDRGIVAFLISPDPNGEDAPSCFGLKADQQGGGTVTFLVDGGSVTPVYGFNSTASRQTFVFPQAGTPEAAGWIGKVADKVSSQSILETTVRLPKPEGAAYSTTATELDALAKAARGRSLRIVADELTPLVVTGGSAGATAIAFDGRAYIRNVDFGNGTDGSGQPSDVVVEAKAGAQVKLSNVVAGGLHALGGSIYVEGDDSLIEAMHGAAANPVLVEGGVVSISQAGGATLLPSVNAPAAATVFDVRGGTLLLVGTPKVVAPPTAIPFAVSGNGKVDSTVDGSIVLNDGTAPAPLTAPMAVSRQDCADGSASCVAYCQPDKAFVSGGCGSADGHALSSFGVTVSGDTGLTGYKCEWAMVSPSLPEAPYAEAACR